MTVTLVAPAKLTVSLTVTGVRPDGYHELRAEMLSLDLADQLTVTEPGEGITLEAAPGVRAASLDLGPQNLIRRALDAVGRTASVHVVKRIPLGAGLGGGSTDAGAILRWASCHDVALAATLGADVPFCVSGGRALVEGIGEQLTPLPYQQRTFLLCLPPFGVDTARVYAAWDQAPCHEGSNELTAAALVVEPRLARWRDALADWTGREPTLAGSGSTWFVEGTTDADQPWLECEGERAPLVRATSVRATSVPPEWGAN